MILASASPRRQKLLKELGADIIVRPARVDEGDCGSGDPAIVSKLLAEKKALWVSARIPPRHKGRIILGADTVVAYRHHVLGKPADENDARRMIRLLSGQWHQVYTGLCVYDPREQIKITGHQMTRVKFRRLSQQKIDEYVSTGEPMDKAGAYGIQGLGSLLVERIDGCYFNVMGLPLVKLDMMLKKIGHKLCSK